MRIEDTGIRMMSGYHAPNTFPVAVIVILLGAGFLRFWNIGWGLPDVFEEATPFFRAWGIWRWGSPGLDFNPHFFNYPGLTFLLHWIVQALHFSAGWVLGAYANLEGFRAAYEADPTRSIVIARCLNATFDIGTVFIVTLMANRLAGSAAALIAGALSACNPLQIRLAQQINVDTPMTFFVAACLWFCLDIHESHARSAYVSAGIAAGLALSCKYAAAPLAAVIVVAHCTHSSGGRGRLCSFLSTDILLALMAASLLFLLCNPWIVLDAAAFRRGISYEALHLETGHFGIAQDSSSPAYYLSDALPASIGWPVMGAALIGAFTCWRRERRAWVPVLVWTLAFASVLFIGRLRADRYVLPIIPALLIFCAGGVLTAATAIGGTRNRLTALLLGLLGVAFVGQSAARTLVYHRDTNATDTRTLAREWLARNFPGESFFVMAPLGITITPPRQALVLPYIALGFDRYAPFYDARWFVDLDLTIGSDFDRGRFTSDPRRFAPFLQFFYDSLETRWTVTETFGPGKETRGPHIWFYRPPAGCSTPLFSEDLMRRLDSVSSARALINFGWNLSAILYYRGKPAKADQLWSRIAGIVLRQADPLSSLEVMSGYPEKIRSDPRFMRLMEALAYKGTTNGP